MPAPSGGTFFMVFSGENFTPKFGRSNRCSFFHALSSCRLATIASAAKLPRYTYSGVTANHTTDPLSYVPFCWIGRLTPASFRSFSKALTNSALHRSPSMVYSRSHRECSTKNISCASLSFSGQPRVPV